MEVILNKMDLFIKGIGNKIYKMVKEQKNGWIVVNMKENIHWVRNKVLVHITGQMGNNILENGKIIKCLEKEYKIGMMGDNIMDIGMII